MYIRNIYLCLLLFVWTVHLASGRTLRPIRNTPLDLLDQASLDKRSISSALDLQSHEEFLWGSDENASTSLGRLVVHMTDECENILNAEKFSPLLRSLKCSTDGLQMIFKDDATFEHAKEVWDWANGEDDRHFVMVIGAGDCGWNDERQPYLIRSLEYDEEGNVANLHGEAQEWHDVAHSYDLDVGTNGDDDMEEDDERGLGSDINGATGELGKRKAQKEQGESFATISQDLGGNVSGSDGGDSESENESDSESGFGSESESGDDSDRDDDSKIEPVNPVSSSIPDTQIGEVNRSKLGVSLKDELDDDVSAEISGQIEGEAVDGNNENSDDSDDGSNLLSIPIGLNIPTAAEFKDRVHMVGAKIRCLHCGFRGRFNVRYKIQRRNWLPTTMKMKLNPSGVGGYLGVRFHVFGFRGATDIKKDFELADFPLPFSINIPKLLDVGPQLYLNWWIGLADIKGQSVLTGDWNSTIPDTATIELDLLDPSQNKVSGWDLSVKQGVLKVEQRISLKFETFIGFNLGLRAQIMNRGFDVRFTWRSIFANIKTEGVTSETGVCGTRNKVGVKGTANIGTALVLGMKMPFKLDTVGPMQDQDLGDFKIGSADLPLKKFCRTWRWPAGEGLPEPGIEKPVADPVEQIYSGTPCMMSNSMNGTCLPTSHCLWAGGTFERDGCSGPDNIQCCSVPERCLQSNGFGGKCISTAACARKGGISEPDQCGGPADIQCCI